MQYTTWQEHTSVVTGTSYPRTPEELTRGAHRELMSSVAPEQLAHYSNPDISVENITWERDTHLLPNVTSCLKLKHKGNSTCFCKTLELLWVVLELMLEITFKITNNPTKASEDRRNNCHCLIEVTRIRRIWFSTKTRIFIYIHLSLWFHDINCDNNLPTITIKGHENLTAVIAKPNFVLNHLN